MQRTKGLPPGGGPPESPEERLDQTATKIGHRWQTATGALVEIGQIAIDYVCGGDEKLAISGAERRALFRRLARRVDALGIGLSPKTLSLAMRSAAADKVVPGNFWKLLDPGRKEDLLPLQKPALLAEGAKFAIEMNPTRENLRIWVDQRNAAEGRKKAPRGLTLGTAVRDAARLGSLTSKTSLERVIGEYGKLKPAKQKEVLAELKSARDSLVLLERRLRQSGR